MRLTNSQVNPLSLLLTVIPEEGLPLTKDSLTRIGNILASGGIVAETYTEVIDLLSYLSDWYDNFIKLETTNGTYKLRKLNG